MGSLLPTQDHDNEAVSVIEVAAAAREAALARSVPAIKRCK